MPLADLIPILDWEVSDKQAALEEADAGKRLELIYGFLTRDLERFETEKQISARVKQQMDSNQREYFLREQMKAIQKELGSDEGSETEDLRQRVADKNMPEYAERALKGSTGSRRGGRFTNPGVDLPDPLSLALVRRRQEPLDTSTVCGAHEDHYGSRSQERPSSWPSGS